ncbi:MAG TPA: hypothetical protein VF631_02410 [Allosphingosinicella sp.]|uniref:hypothetical protein n=1 Tax=Allosphingosinicella sp. TaxID=2823234 RepID=UPI002F26E80C
MTAGSRGVRGSAERGVLAAGPAGTVSGAVWGTGAASPMGAVTTGRAASTTGAAGFRDANKERIDFSMKFERRTPRSGP